MDPAVFLTADVAFFGSMIVKVFAGGWFPIAVGAAIFIVMTTWNRGKALLAQKIQERIMSLEDFFVAMESKRPSRAPGTAVFMTKNISGTPLALVNNLLYNNTVHEHVVLLTVLVEEVSYVNETERVTVESLNSGFTRVIARYGFMETPDVLALLARDDTPTPPIEKTTFFLGNEVVLPEGSSNMMRWRAHLFAYLARNATRPTTFFNVPTSRVMEIGSQIPM